MRCFPNLFARFNVECSHLAIAPGKENNIVVKHQLRTEVECDSLATINWHRSPKLIP